MIALLRKIPAKALILTALAAVALLSLVFAVRSCQSAQTAKTQADLAKGQAGAAIQSGADAVETQGNVNANATATHATVKDGTDAIDKATPGDSNDAADRAACQLKSYRKTPKCVTLLGPAQ